MNKQTIKVSSAVYISKAYDDIIFNSNYAVMLLKRLIPFF